MALGKPQFRFLIDQALIEPGQCRDYFDGGAGLESALIRQLLVDDSQKATGLRVNHHDTAVIGSQRGYRGSADHQVFAVHGIALATLVRGGAVRPWLAASVAGDIADVGAAFASRDGLPDGSATATAAVAGGSAALTAAVAAALD